ncbi:MAG: hypothetical protein IJM27_03665 [Eubacterium sp.]|nr:hypothetical protein [Eubacterium sp.]
MNKRRLFSAVAMLLFFFGALILIVRTLSSIDPSLNADTGRSYAERPASAGGGEVDPVKTTATQIEEVISTEYRNTGGTEALNEPPRNTLIKNSEFYEKVSSCLKTSAPIDPTKESEPAIIQDPEPIKASKQESEDSTSPPSIVKLENTASSGNNHSNQNESTEKSEPASGTHSEAAKTDPASNQPEKSSLPSTKGSENGSVKESSNDSANKTDATTAPDVPAAASDTKVTPPVVSTNEKVTENATENTTENTTVKPKCNHNWVWKTHTETKFIPAKTHDVPVYDDGWDEAVTVQKIYCSSCQNIYEDLDDYYDHDFCFGSFGHMTVIDHYIHHEPELLFIDTILDEPAHNETITVNDYEYCSRCGEKK